MMNRDTAGTTKVAEGRNLLRCSEAKRARVPAVAFLFALVISAISFTVQAHAQGALIPVLECLEYSTGGTVAPSTSAVPGSASVIGHFGYLNTTQTTRDIPFGFDGDNFLSPTTTERRQPIEYFYPGWHSHAFRVQYPSNQRFTWFLGITYATGAPLSQQNLQASPPLVATPTCPAALLPASVSFTAAGTYTHQYLAQVESGPPSDVAVVVTASASSPNVILSNLSYVAADPANPPYNPSDPTNAANVWNPNSVYGDVTIGSSASGSATVAIAVAAEGRVLTTGISKITLPAQASTPIPAPITAGCPADVSMYVTSTVNAAKQTLGSSTWTQTVTIKNTSNLTIAGPILVALTGLSSNASLFSAAGYGTCSGIAGAPYAYVTGALAPGASAAALLTFTNSQVPSAAITFTPMILSGGSRL